MLRRQRAARATKNHSRRTKVRLCAVLSPPQFVNPAKPAVSLIRVAKPSYTTRTLCAIAPKVGISCLKECTVDKSL